MSSSTAQIPLNFTAGAALVTGAASGIGKAVAKLLADSGLMVYAVDLNKPEAAENITPLQCDVSDDASVDALIKSLDTSPGYLVNCAGILDPTGFVGVKGESFLRVLNINLVGSYRLIDRLAELGGLASVVNITSIEASRVVALSDPDPHPAYAASKSATSMLTKTASRALAPKGIRVNAIAPGFVQTPMAMEHGQGDQLPPALEPRVPLKRFAKPEEIARSVAFLLSDEASYITGAELHVDGGFRQT